MSKTTLNYDKEAILHFLLTHNRRRKAVRIPNKINENIAYLCGVLAGDGRVSCWPHFPQKHMRTSLHFYNQSKDYLQYIAGLFGAEFGVSGKIYAAKGRCMVLSEHNRDVWLYFVKDIGFPLDKKFLTIPEPIRTKALFRYYLAGLFDTDGFFSKTFGIMMAHRSLGYLKDISQLAKELYGLEFGKMCSNTLHQNGKVYERIMIQLRTKSIIDFWREIPLKHERYKERKVASLRARSRVVKMPLLHAASARLSAKTRGDRRFDSGRAHMEHKDDDPSTLTRCWSLDLPADKSTRPAGRVAKPRFSLGND